MGSGGAATFVGADIVERGRGRGPIENGGNELKYHKAYSTQRGQTSLSHSLLSISTQAHIWRIQPSLLTIYVYVYASYPIYYTGPNIHLSNPPTFTVHIFLRC
jgi:hypothetical protein